MSGRKAPSPPSSVPGAATDPLQQARLLCTHGRFSEAEPLCRSVLERDPSNPGALWLLGTLLAQTRRLHEAAELFGRLAAAMPDSADVQTNYGNVLRTLGRAHDALACYERALALKPDSAEAHYNRGLALGDLRQYDLAVQSYERAAGLKEDYAAAWTNRGGLLHKLGRYEEALVSIDRALALQPNLPAAHNNRGITLRMLGRLQEALASFEAAIALGPNYADAHANRGVTLRTLERYGEALACLDRALELQPRYAEAHAHRGDTLHALQQFEEALASYDRAIALLPRSAEAHARRGTTLNGMRHYVEALVSFDRALAVDPGCLIAHVNRGVTLKELKRLDEALGSIDQAIRLGAGDAHVHYYRGALLQELNAFEEAIASYERGLAIAPQTRLLRGNSRHARMQICDWNGFEDDKTAISAALERGEELITPFVLLSLIDSPALQRRAAEISRLKKPQRNPLPSLTRQPSHDRVRIGYFSSDLRNHAVAMLTAGLFETHDRSRFELTAFSLGSHVPDELRSRVAATFDRFLQVDGQSDRAVAALARELEIDIAVDLGGYTRDARPGIMALRAAPIQASYLGYLGTLGGNVDYLLADSVLIPAAARAHYSEQIAYLPSYQVNDSKRPGTGHAFTRAALGLPASDFVFCCFNNTYKITPETFDSWMRILGAVPGSVLYLLGGVPVAERNLRREAGLRGIAPERLVFGGSLPFAEYLARYRSMDLFLDTLPYNAGTTASDALWTGLPVLTLPGESFASRMAASVLTAAGLPELIAQNRADYEHRAIELASDARRLAALKLKLAASRGQCLLFDTASFARNLESLYQQMYQRHLSGLPPVDLFSMDCAPAGSSAASLVAEPPA